MAVLGAFGDEAGGFVGEDGHDGEAVGVEGVDGACDEVEVGGGEGGGEKLGEVFFFAGGEEFIAFGLSAAVDGAEADDAAEAELAGEEAVE